MRIFPNARPATVAERKYMAWLSFGPALVVFLAIGTSWNELGQVFCTAAGFCLLYEIIWSLMPVKRIADQIAERAEREEEKRRERSGR